MPKPLKFRIDYEHEDGSNVESCMCDEGIDREFAHALLDEFLDAYEDGRAHKSPSDHDFPHELSFTPCGIH
jgi:hypothetical protein